MLKTHRKKPRVAGHGAIDRKNVLEICRKVSATVGSDFFNAIAQHLAEALAADGVFVVEFAGGRMERCRTVGGWLDGAPAKFEYELAGSATAEIVVGKPFQCRSHARQKFPSDALVAKAEAEAYIGVPLPENDPMGALIALYRRPVASLQFAKAVLDVFAERAAAEIVRRMEEEALLQSEQRYRAFIARNGDAMWRLEFEQPIPTSLPEEEQFQRIYKYGYLAECNDALARLLGFERGDQLIGMRVEDIAPAKDSALRHATMTAIRAGYRLTNVETSPMDPSGRRRCMIRSQWGIVEGGELQRIWGSSRDITELRETEMALHAAEQQMADLLESMRLLVVFVDAAGNIGFCNAYVYELTGWTAADVLGKPWLNTLIPGEEREKIATTLERVEATPDQPVHFETTLAAKEGAALQVAWDSIALRSADGSPATRAIMGRDVTEQKGLEEQLRQAQKLSGIGRLAGGLAHDFNNLLTVILGYTIKLLENVRPSDPAFLSLAGIQKATERGAELAHRLLTFSRRQPFRPQVMDVNTVVEDAEGLVQTLVGEGISLVVKLETGLRSVRADPTHLQQILMNLAANARDAMPQGGMLTIATANYDADTAHPHPAGIPEGEYALLTVADTGTGMADEVKAHLFEPFFSTKANKGTGLGLATVYGIVQQMLGHIRVDSELGRGTAFRIFFPKTEAASLPKESAPERELPHGRESVLLVDERRDLRLIAATILRNAGYTVHEADGPLEAMEIGGDERIAIDLLLSEVAPHGMPGHVLLDMMRATHPEIKVLFLAERESVMMMDGGTGPEYDYLPEPVSPLALARKVREVLDRN